MPRKEPEISAGERLKRKFVWHPEIKSEFEELIGERIPFFKKHALRELSSRIKLGEKIVRVEEKYMEKQSRKADKYEKQLEAKVAELPVGSEDVEAGKLQKKVSDIRLDELPKRSENVERVNGKTERLRALREKIKEYTGSKD